MKSMMRGLALAVALIVPSVSQAEFVATIDTFASGASTGFADTSRSALGGTAVFKSVSAGTLAATAVVVGQTVTWDLNVIGNSSGIQTVGNGGVGHSHFLKLIGLNNLGSWDLTVSATGTGGIGPAGTHTYTTAVNGDQILDLALLTNLGHLNGLTKLSFTATATALDGGAATFVLDAMAIVPEPTSMALLGLTAVGGFFANRRRKKTVVA